MAFIKKSSMVLLSTMCLALVVSACGSNSGSNKTNSPASTTGNSSSAAPSGKKINLTLMFAWPGDTNAEEEEKMVKEHFKDKYDITFKQVDANVEKTIKTTIAAGEPVDLAFYWPNGMETFVNANMALDLTPYMQGDPKWRDSFIDGTLNLGTYNGKVYAVPNTPVYGLMIANKDLLDKAGVTLPDQPTWDEFTKALATIKAKLSITPFGNAWPSWTNRFLLQTIWPNEQKLQEWNDGKIPFTDPTVVKAFDQTKDLYDKEYMYPGKGALTVTQDQVLAGFKDQKVAIMATVNFIADGAIKNAGIKNPQILSWPTNGTGLKLSPAANGYMIPANVKHPEASVEIMKYLTSPEVLQYRIDHGAPVTVKGVKPADSNSKVELYARDAGNPFHKEIGALDPKLNDYNDTKMPANYIFKGMAALEEMDKLRQDAIKQK
ncbi:extracellular solute-binding protein [Paenibacillus sp. LjRoot153]|uniref:ABC transporter substrate-binding protein n=1 Tax=Paenibacillus sp. LjRoot153 TaxID=3342270 RepID=UPI003ECD3F94